MRFQIMKNYRLIFSALVFLLASPLLVLATDGDLDPSFNPGASLSSSPTSIAMQADGKIIVGTNLSVVRLNMDGSVDANFNTSIGGGDGNYLLGVYSAAIQTDGKIIIGGTFTIVNSVAINRIARLNSDGSLDMSFNPGGGVINNAYAGAPQYVVTIAVQTDGKIIIGGTFNTVSGVARKDIARLNSNGSLDSAFNPGASVGGSGEAGAAYPSINAAALQTDGKIVIGGRFVSFDGVPRQYIARLNNNGSLDASFNVVGIGGNYPYVSSLVVQANGKVIICGRDIFRRVNTDGSLDSGFSSTFGDCNAIAVQPDGKIIASGSTSVGEGVSLLRLNANGSVDASFNQVVSGFAVSSAVVHAEDGSLIIIGGFYVINGVARNHIARIVLTPDTDSDGLLNNVDLDDDDDGVPDVSDNCPLKSNADLLNVDGDAWGDVCDWDIDNDGTVNEDDAFPFNAAEWTDTDNDGIGDNADTDDDNDGLVDVTDNCPTTSNASQLNTDGDSQGNVCDSDSDNDGMLDTWEILYGLDPLDASDASDDLDGDGFTNLQEYQNGSNPTKPPTENDFDKDGDADLLIRSTNSGNWQLFKMNNGTTLSSNAYVAYTTADWQLASSEDFDGDGDTDILLRNTTTGAWRMFIAQNGLVASDSAFGAYASTSWQVASVADFNNDGIKDILLHDTASGAWRVFYVTNGTTTTNANMALYATGWSLQSAKDFDGDGDADIVLRSNTEGLWRIFTVQSGVVASNALLPLYGNTSWTLKAAEDLDNDGDTDMVMRGPAGDWRVFNIQNNTVVNNAALGLYLSLNWSLDHTNDVNKDGDADLILRSTTGDWRLFNIQDRAVSSNVALGLYANTAWQTADTVDVDGNGVKDVILNNSTTGAWRAFMISNGVVTSNTNPGLYQSVDWVLQNK